MKANEAPEKIYMTPSFGVPDNILLASFSKSHLDYHRDIEYTRTDAFIEKAEKYLTEKFIKDVSILAMGGVSINFAPAISNFLKYMKGE